MYQEQLLDHYHHPRHKGTLPHHDFSSGKHNPSCGDAISFEGKVQDEHIVDLKFSGTGCVISQATASLLADYALTKSISDIQALNSSFILSLIGISLGPTRLRCALLSLEALQAGLLCLTVQK